MLYMKEQRAQVVAECTLKESAAINQILGRKVPVVVCNYGKCFRLAMQLEHEKNELPCLGIRCTPLSCKSIEKLNAMAIVVK